MSRSKNLVRGGSLLGEIFPIGGRISKFSDSGSAISLVGKILYINPPISERTLFSNFDHFPHNTHILLSFYLVSLILWLFYWMGDQATSDVLFHFWHYGSTHAKSCYLSITITLQCFICNLASVYWDLTYDLVFLVLWFNVTYTYTHRGHINIY